MPKSKKKKNKDFQKVKFKVGRKLQQADNETTSKFHTVKVQVVQKLKSGSSESSGKKEFKLQDLLLQSRHYSPNVRAEGITNMRELISSKPDILQSDLSVIIESVSESFSDKEDNARKAGIKLFKLIVTKVTEDQLVPFFNIVSAHLSCSMTHIMDDIRMDSLKLFDALLEFYPKLLVERSAQLLQNFIEQISKQTSGGKRNNSIRSLNLNPDSKTSTHKWRRSVLSRIGKLMKAMGENLEEKDHTTKLCEDECFAWSPYMKPIQVFPMYMKNSWNGVGYTFDSKDKVSSRGGQDLDLQSFVDILIPLLLECWMESVPEPGMGNLSGNCLSGHCVSLLYEVLTVMESLLICSRKQDKESKAHIMNMMRDKYLKDLDAQIIKVFPYSVNSTASKKDDVPVSAEAFNLTICNIMANMITEAHIGEQHQEVWVEKISQYICRLSNKKLPPEEFRTFIAVIKQLLFLFGEDSLNEIMSRIHHTFSKESISKRSVAVFELMEDVCLSMQYQNVVSKSFIGRFLGFLPEMFINQSEDGTLLRSVMLRIMKKAASQRNLEFLNSLCNNQVQLLKKLATLPVILHKPLVELVYSIPRFDDVLLKEISRVCLHSDVPENTILYLLSVTENRFLHSGQPMDLVTCSLLLKFIFTLISGHMDEDQPTLPVSDSNLWGCSVSSENIETFHRKKKVSDYVCAMLTRVPSIEELIPVIEQFSVGLLNEDRSVPAYTAFGVLNCWTRIAEYVNQSDRQIPGRVVQLILSIMQLHVSHSEHTDADIQGELAALWRACVMAYPASLTEIYSAILTKVQENVSSAEDVDTITKMASLPMKSDDMRSNIDSLQLKDKVHLIIDTIKPSYPDSATSKSFSELTYRASLLS